MSSDGDKRQWLLEHGSVQEMDLETPKFPMIQIHSTVVGITWSPKYVGDTYVGSGDTTEDTFSNTFDLIKDVLYSKCNGT